MNTPRRYYRLGTALRLVDGWAPARGQEPAPVALTVYPPEVSLLTSRGQQTFVVQAGYADGITRDVTDKARASLANPALAKLERNVLTPAADGETQLVVEFAG